MKKFFYRVQKGDSVISLSNRFSVPTCDLIKDNALKGEIEEGDVLILSPCEDAVFVSPHENAETIFKRTGKDGEKMLKSNNFLYFFYGLVLKP